MRARHSLGARQRESGRFPLWLADEMKCMCHVRGNAVDSRSNEVAGIGAHDDLD